MELYEKINELGKAHSEYIVNTNRPFEKCYTNNAIYWSMFNTDKFLQFLELLNQNEEWKKIMYSKEIPIDMLENYKDYLDWDYITMYGCTNILIDKYMDKINWNIFSSKKCTTLTLEKYIDKINFDVIAKHQTLQTKFIDKYKDKLNWVDICMYQVLNVSFIESHLDYITEPCWINISKYQVLSHDFILKYGDKLNWKIMSVYQNIAYLDIMEKYEDQIDWEACSFYQPLNYQIIEKYAKSKKLNFDKVIQNPGIHFDDELIDYLIDNAYLTDNNMLMFLNKNVSPYRIEHVICKCIEKYPNVICWNPTDEKISNNTKKCVSSLPYLSNDFIKTYKDKLYWPVIDIHNIEGLPFSLLYEKRNMIGAYKWKEISKFIVLPEDFIEYMDDYIDWYNISKYQNLSDMFIDKYADKLSWESLIRKYNLPEELLIRHQDKINWNQYIFLHPLTDTLWINCINYIDIQYYMNNYELNVSNETLLEIYKNNNNALNNIAIEEIIYIRKQKAYKEGYIIKEFENIQKDNKETKSETIYPEIKENIFKRIFRKWFKK
ncbi:MAG: hypothetical protein [Wendovervirus sonii]|uniref:Uncharacterized protein n=1 Tax=phage Lak_Megaphage_Sonny TaxID=3109229 RepID=A0ABZ0Z3E9_9CAUD|nr:MAG: hypothetical protein [phage Lak_Megaphage_Sonny]